MTDEPPDWVAHLDQVRKSIDDFASVVAAYYNGLVLAGLPPDVATALAMGFQQIAFTMGAQMPDSPEESAE